MIQYNARVLRTFLIAGLLLFAVLVPLVAMPLASFELPAPTAVGHAETATHTNAPAIAFVALSLLRAPPSR